ncbi:class I SAM-dependent methyltransferase [Azospirillum sp.]|uniref:class I SAM-dependent methyltransferase n=1 Tax=Azospirillum sp. TaxID=34012 RepID=UPI003D7475A5
MNDVPTVATTTPTGSSDRFGYEWGHYSELKPIYEEQFRRWTPFFGPDDWAGRTFVDVGCGMGRNSHWPMTYGATGGLAIDLDERSLASARRTLAPHAGIEVRRQSAYDLDERDRFDVAFSIGVIHHLEDPDRALANMTRAVKPGGSVMIWVYGLENNRWIAYGLTPLRRALFSRLPIGLTHALSLPPTMLLWLALRLGAGRTEYMRLIRGFDFAHLRSIVFDQMLPQIAHYWSRAEVEALMRRAGLENVRLEWVNEMSWAAIGRKPG